MRQKLLIAGIAIDCLSAVRFVSDLLGDVDMLHTLTDKGSWLYAYGPFLIGALLIAWALLPTRKKAMPENDKPRVIGPLVGVDIRYGKNISFNGTSITNTHTAIKVGQVDGLLLNGVKISNDVPPEQSPEVAEPDKPEG